MAGRLTEWAGGCSGTAGFAALSCEALVLNFESLAAGPEASRPVFEAVSCPLPAHSDLRAVALSFFLRLRCAAAIP